MFNSEQSRTSISPHAFVACTVTTLPLLYMVILPRRRWEDNIKMDLQEVGGGRGDWMELAQNMDGWRSLVGTVRNCRVP